MTLAFYKVDNSKNYERHTVDLWYDRPQVIKEMLSGLSDEELRMYDVDNKYDIIALEDDYNDAVIDGRWWCVVIND